MSKRITRRAYKKVSGPLLRRGFYTITSEEHFDKIMHGIMERNAEMFRRLAK